MWEECDGGTGGTEVRGGGGVRFREAKDDDVRSNKSMALEI